MKISKYLPVLLLALLSLANGFSIAQANGSQSDSTVMYYHHDVRGDPVVVKTETGNIQWIESYRAYGSAEDRVSSQGIGIGDNSNENHANRFGYTGHESDMASGLTYMQQRYYDPLIARFVSNDPVGFTSANIMMFNRYAYGNNNPYRFIDPDGKAPHQTEIVQLDTLVSHVADLEQRQSNREVLANIQDLSIADVEGGGRYIYTDKYQYVDLRHFAAAGKTTTWLGGVATLYLGEILEQRQAGVAERDRVTDPGAIGSSFSHEDVPSNQAGADFGNFLMKNIAERGIFEPRAPMSELINQFFSEAGGNYPVGEEPFHGLLPDRDLGSAAVNPIDTIAGPNGP